MQKFLITLPQIPHEEVKKAWAKVTQASGGSGCTMEKAYIKKYKDQAICCWDAPDRETIEGLFAKEGLITESVEEVDVYDGK